MGSTRPRTMKRRRFVQFLAAGSAATLAGAAAALADPMARLARAAQGSDSGARDLPPDLAAEIANQKQYLEKTLKTIRDYELPPGSDPAFTFAPRKTRRGR